MGRLGSTSPAFNIARRSMTALTAANGYLYVGTDNGLVRASEQKLHP